MKRLTLFLVTLLAISIGGCGSDNGAPGGSGLLEADETIVSAETSGRVISMAFDEGTTVNDGDTLLRIDPSRLELQLQSAEAGRKVALAQLESARLQLAKAEEAEAFASSERDRFAKLYQSGTTTQKQLDQLEFELSQAILSRKTAAAAVTTLQAQLSQIDANIATINRELKDCYPLSPLAGVVTEKYVDEGELLKPGGAIAKISLLSSLWVKVYLPAGDFAKIRVGDSATIDTESGGETYRGEVVWTSEEAEFTPKNVQTEQSRANLVYAVKVRMENTDGNLKIGMPVYVTLGE